MKRIFSSFSICCALSSFILCVQAEASHLYDFVEEGTEIVMATLELSSLPATHAEVVGLTFTPDGQAALGYGPTYEGIFDESVNAFVSGFDGSIGRLLSSTSDPSSITDTDPPDSSFHPGGTATASITIRNNNDTDYGNSLLALTPNNPGDGVIELTGAFIAIPEPGAVVLFGLSGVIVLVQRRLR